MANSGKRAMRACLICGLSVVATACGGSGTDGGESPKGSGGTPGTSLGGAGGSSDAKGGANVGGANVGGQSLTGGGGQSPTGGSSTNVGGQSPAGGSGGGTSITSVGTNPTGPKGQCPVWPNERFFPLVGIFFYGNNPKPCTRTITPEPNTSSSIAGTYDLEYDGAGYLVKMTLRDGTVSYVYAREQGVIVSETDAKATSLTNLTYYYGPTSAKYEVRYDSTLRSTFEYARDAQGYPLSARATFSNSAAAAPDYYVYEYDGCRIRQRTPYFSNGTVDDTQTQTYEYDAEGRIVTIRSPHLTETFDYSCS